jgi:hypothetical protein
MQNFRMLAIAAAAVFASGTAFAAPSAFSGQATLAKPASAPVDATVSGVAWHCEADKCVGAAERYSSLDNPVKECRKVAEAVGPLTAYASRGRALSKGSLTACNANALAKGGPAETAQK